jgi:hypothetical protein
MKKICAILFAVMLAGQAWAQTTFEIGNIKYTVTGDNTVSVAKGLSALIGALEIPSQVTNIETDIEYTVTSIHDSAFSGCTGITSVIVPNTVANIGNAAFSGCSSLQSITLPFVGDKEHTPTDKYQYPFGYIFGTKSYSGGTKTSQSYFHDIVKTTTFFVPSSLREVTITGSTHIPRGAFGNCSMLTSITLPNTITSIGERAFYKCKGNKYDNAYYVGTTDNPYLCLIGPIRSDIPPCTINNNCKFIVGGAFVGCGPLNTLFIPSSVIFIGKRAFDLYETKLEFENIESICNIQYEHCDHLTEYNGEFHFENNFEKYYPEDVDWSTTHLFIKSKGFYMNNSEVTELVIPDGVTSINNFAFANCSKLTTVSIPNTVTEIGHATFQACSGITEISIPESVTSIGINSFNNCSELTTISIPNSITYIGHGAFDGCDKLQYNEYDNAYYLGNDENQFVCLVKAKSTDITSCEINSNCKIIYKGAFSGCNKLTSIVIPNTVTNIGRGVFYECSSLISISLPFIGLKPVTEDMIYINDAGHTCYNCLYEDYTYFHILRNPDDIRHLEMHNPNLKEMIITGNSIIQPNALSDCHITSIIISNSITRIGEGALDVSYPLNTDITLYSTTPPSLDNNYSPHCHYIYVPCTSVESYYSTTWINNSMGIIGAFHTIVDVDRVEPTCTERGIVSGIKCSGCNEIFRMVYINALGHAYDTVTFAPTCTNLGYKELTCTRCNDVIYIDTVAATGHSYITGITAPTCTEVGYTTHTCSVCEYSYNSDTVSANGHTADCIVFENPVAATCTVAGSRDSVVYCSVCRDELFREKKEIPATGHNYSTSVTTPTCTAVGFTNHTCSICNHTYYSDTVTAKGHTEIIDAAIAATCTAVGKTEGKHCSVCNAILVAQEEVAALGHEFEKYIYNNDATTAADGTETATCTRGCGATDTRVAEGTKLAETPEKGTAVSEVASTLNIYAHGNTIVVENATDEISVYNAMGILICRDAIHRVRTEINVTAPGVYIVKTGSVVKRVMVN